MKMRSKLLAHCMLLIVGVFLLPRHVQAQNIYAALHGSVKDSTGAVVPGASVTAVNKSTGISTSAVTDGSGYYIFPQLQIGGPYTVSVTKPGFQDFQSTGLMLNVNANRDVDAVLQVGTTAQTVHVMSAAV
ncbi:MAG: carboxypeptidase-like regulatory domain-containing protein [Acidobacteriaceae bacterium]